MSDAHSVITGCDDRSHTAGRHGHQRRVTGRLRGGSTIRNARGTSADAVALMRATVGTGIGVEASGGIRTLADVEEMWQPARPDWG